MHLGLSKHKPLASLHAPSQPLTCSLLSLGSLLEIRTYPFKHGPPVVERHISLNVVQLVLHAADGPVPHDNRQ